MADLAQLAAIQALAATLVHFLWQGTIVALLVAVVMRISRTAAARYAVGVVGLLVMLSAPFATFVVLNGSASPAPGSSIALSQIAGPSGQLAATAPSAQLAVAPDTVFWPAAGVIVWMTGIVVLSVRLAGGWLVARRMATRAVRPAGVHIQQLAAELAERLALARAVQVLESSAVAVPLLVGWLRPTIIFPVAALAGLSPAQIEALLAHELAHVRRHDYLVNLLQSFVEVVLFYHPAIWWLSRRVRIERELCCDDEAVGICDRLVYATALTDLAAMRTPRVALAATGGDLLARVRRILGREESSMSARGRWAPAVIAFAAVLAAVPVLVASVHTPSVQTPVEEQAATIPQEPAARLESAPLPSEAVSEQEISMQDLERRIAELRALLESDEVDLAPMFAEPQNRERAEQARNEQERARAQAEIESAKKELERTRQLFDKGLVSRQQVVDAELALAMIQAGGDERRQRNLEAERARRQLEQARERLQKGVTSADEVARLESQLALLAARRDEQEVKAREAEIRMRELNALSQRGLVSERDLQEIEARLKEFGNQSRAYAIERDRAMQNQKEQEAKFRELIDRSLKERVDKNREFRERVQDMLQKYEGQRAEFERMVRERERAGVRERLDLPRETRPDRLEAIPSRPIQAGDTLFVSIEGETQLPTLYRIESNGAIRVPLLGSFSVIGQTPGQVRESIGKRLMDAKLGSPAKVRVELRRERERAPER